MPSLVTRCMETFPAGTPDSLAFIVGTRFCRVHGHIQFCYGHTQAFTSRASNESLAFAALKNVHAIGRYPDTLTFA